MKSIHEGVYVVNMCRYFSFGAATAILMIGLSAKPDTSLVHWAEKEAKARRSDL